MLEVVLIHLHNDWNVKGFLFERIKNDPKRKINGSTMITEACSLSLWISFCFVNKCIWSEQLLSINCYITNIPSSQQHKRAVSNFPKVSMEQEYGCGLLGILWFKTFPRFQSSFRLGLQSPQGSLGADPLPVSLAWSLWASSSSQAVGLRTSVSH